MNIESVLKLVDAGFSKNEIAAMLGAERPAEPETPTVEETSAPVETKPETAPDDNSAIAELTRQVSQLTTLVQKSNLLRMEMPEIQTPSPEDLLSEIIFPTRGNNNK